MRFCLCWWLDKAIFYCSVFHRHSIEQAFSESNWNRRSTRHMKPVNWFFEHFICCFCFCFCSTNRNMLQICVIYYYCQFLRSIFAHHFICVERWSFFCCCSVFLSLSHTYAHNFDVCYCYDRPRFSSRQFHCHIRRNAQKLIHFSASVFLFTRIIVVNESTCILSIT